MSKQQERSRYPSMFPKLKSALVLTLVILLGSLGFYYLHVQRKSDYLTSRNFRLLTSMGERFKITVRSQGWILRHLSKTDGFMEAARRAEAPQGKASRKETPQKKEERRKHAQRKSEILRVIAPQFEAVKILSVTVPQEPEIWHEMHPGPSEPRLKVFYRVDEQSVLEGEVRLSRIVDRSLAPREAFEAVLLAGSDGRVIHQKESPALGITHLSALVGSKETDPKTIAGGVGSPFRRQRPSGDRSRGQGVPVLHRAILPAGPDHWTERRHGPGG